jgi:histidinol phosphatase-like enzyme
MNPINVIIGMLVRLRMLSIPIRDPFGGSGGVGMDWRVNSTSMKYNNKSSTDIKVKSLLYQGETCYNCNILSMDEVFSGILPLKNPGSAGPDGIPAQFLVPCDFGLCKPIHHLFNLSTDSGVVPALWKNSYLIPIHKSGDRGLITNYRGISIQPTLAKLLDRLMSNQLRTAYKQVIDSFQHGFRQGRSTSTNLLIYQNYIVEALENGYQVDSIYEDFSKAFDRVNHNILIHKLRLMNFDGMFVNWLESFISDRSQLVKIGKCLSNPIEVKSGVPQGSHCGPLLFDLFINDIILCVQFSKLLLFVDDLKIFKKISSIQDCFLLQRDLNSINDWGACNDIKVNIAKCNKISFFRTEDPFLFDYKIDNFSVNVVQGCVIWECCLTPN